MHFTQLAQHDFLIHGIQVAGGLIGQDDLRISIRRRYADALLSPPESCEGRWSGAVPETDVVERRQGFGFISHAVEILGQHNVFKGREVGNQVKLLEDEADLFRAEAVQLRRVILESSCRESRFRL